MHPDRGFTWTKVARRQIGVLAAAVVLLATNMGAVRAAAGDPYDPATDSYSMRATARAMGADAFWAAGYTGAGVDVALIDSGVAPVAGLDAPGKVVFGPDLSLESQSPDLRNFDTFGHGTVMAGLIAGNDGTETGYRGIAPDARIVSLKVATADGGTDVSQMIAAIYWVIDHRTDNGLNIRVLNLSYGTNTKQSYLIDPLAFAVERAWKSGIVVVAAAGNSGYQRGKLAPGMASPAYDPMVIGVGGYDANDSATWHDDVMGSYSASSTGKGGAKNPDFVAPGSHMQGLRVPGSFLDQAHPEGRRGDRFFRGSGTSQAAALTSGAIALILQRNPGLTPDQVKRFITDNAQKLPGSDSQAQGDGEVNLRQLLSRTPGRYVQKVVPSTGTGSLEAARGSDHISAGGVVLQGEIDIFGAPFSGAAMATAAATGNTWSGGTWNGNTWAGNTWSGNTWSGNTWAGNTWAGNTWSGNTWSGNTWSGNTWSGNTWSGNTWAGSSLSGNTWSGNTWSGDDWG